MSINLLDKSRSNTAFRRNIAYCRAVSHVPPTANGNILVLLQLISQNDGHLDIFIWQQAFTNKPRTANVWLWQSWLKLSDSQSNYAHAHFYCSQYKITGTSFGSLFSMASLPSAISPHLSKRVRSSEVFSLPQVLQYIILLFLMPH